MPTLKIDVDGLDTAATGLRKFAAGVEDWRPYWRLLGETLATEAGSRWPLRRRSGRLRKSLTWRGDTLGPRGIFESSVQIALQIRNRRCFTRDFFSTVPESSARHP